MLPAPFSPWLRAAFRSCQRFARSIRARCRILDGRPNTGKYVLPAKNDRILRCGDSIYDAGAGGRSSGLGLGCYAASARATEMIRSSVTATPPPREEFARGTLCRTNHQDADRRSPAAAKLPVDGSRARLPAAERRSARESVPTKRPGSWSIRAAPAIARRISKKFAR